MYVSNNSKCLKFWPSLLSALHYFLYLTMFENFIKKNVVEKKQRRIDGVFWKSEKKTMQTGSDSQTQ